MSPAGGRLLTAPFLLAWVGSFLSSLVVHTLIHLPGLLTDLGAGEVEVGTIVGVFGASAIAIRPVVGRLMDERGRRLVVRLGAAAQVIAAALYLTVDSLGPWVYFVRAFHGIVEATLFSVFFTIGADLIPAGKRAQGIAIFGISGMLPVSLGGLLGDVVLAHAGYQELFFILWGISVVCLFAVLPIKDTRPPASGPPPRGFLASARQPSLIPLWVVGLGFAFSASSTFTFLKTFTLETGHGSVGLYFTAYAMTAIVERITIGWLPDRLGAKRTLFPAMLMMAAGLGVLAVATSDVGVALAGVLCGAGHGFLFPVLSALVVTRAPVSERGAAMSLFTALFDAGLLIGGPTLGLVVTFADHRAMFATAAVVAVVAWGSFAFLDRGRHG